MWEERFAGYTAWKKAWYNDYRRNGGFDTLTGFRIDGLLSRNQVLNYPIQGSAFHCLLWALNRVQRTIERRKMRTLLVGQIHDSMLADVPLEELQNYLDLTHDVITRQLPNAWDWIIVPIEAEAEVCMGGTWADKKQWTKQNGIWAEKS
jgi:DNA polymerase I-like protein with 3'-5' exonuclease and polymerase domains